MGVPDTFTRLGGSMATALKVVVLALACAAMVSAAGVAVGIDNADLKEAMAEAEDTDSALEWTRKHLRNWGGDYKKILKHMPPLALKGWGQSCWCTGSNGKQGVQLSDGIKQRAADSR